MACGSIDAQTDTANFRFGTQDHIKAALRIVKPEIDLDEIMPRPVCVLTRAFKGELSRIVLDTLCQITKPLATREITLALMKARRLNIADTKIVRMI